MKKRHQLIANYYAQHRDEIVHFITVRIADADESKDMVQELFLRLLDDRRLITPITLPNLVYTMARHQIADYYRRRRVYEEYEHYIRRSDGTDFSMESVISARLLMERMEYSLARIPENCREVYRLHVYDGMRVREISQELHQDYKSVEYRLGIARKTIRHQLRACV